MYNTGFHLLSVVLLCLAMSVKLYDTAVMLNKFYLA